MASRKRGSAEMEALPSRPRREEAKRTKLSPAAEDRSDSSLPSTCSVSEASALQSTPPASDRDDARSSISSAPSDREDSLSSSSEESSDSDDDDDGDGDEPVTIGGPKKPQIGTPAVAQDLQARISALLPRLAAANRELEASGLNMEDVEEGERCIEMDLGLGVLEEKGERESGESEEGSDEEEVEGDVPISSGAVKREKETSVMDALLGKRDGVQKPGIEEMG